MKWLPGSDEYWQYAAEDQRYRVAKYRVADGWTYTAWYRHGPGPTDCAALSEPRNKDLSAARKAAEAHYAGMQRRAA